jgi:hypothetical protein
MNTTTKPLPSEDNSQNNLYRSTTPSAIVKDTICCILISLQGFSVRQLLLAHGKSLLGKNQNGPVSRPVDLSQVQHVALDHAPSTDAPVLDNAPVAMLLAVILATLGAQEHDGRALSADPPCEE